jgi:hypothetical protein
MCASLLYAIVGFLVVGVIYAYNEKYLDTYKTYTSINYCVDEQTYFDLATKEIEIASIEEKVDGQLILAFLVLVITIFYCGFPCKNFIDMKKNRPAA